MERNQISDLLVQKFVSEEIMTKSEFQQTIDRIMEKHEARINANMDARFDAMENRFVAIDHKFEAIDRKFEAIDRKFEAIDHRFEVIDHKFDSLESRMDRQFLKIDARYNWIIGITLTSAITLAGMMLKLFYMLPIIH